MHESLALILRGPGLKRAVPFWRQCSAASSFAQLFYDTEMNGSKDVCQVARALSAAAETPIQQVFIAHVGLLKTAPETPLKHLFWPQGGNSLHCLYGKELLELRIG